MKFAGLTMGERMNKKYIIVLIIICILTAIPALCSISAEEEVFVLTEEEKAIVSSYPVIYVALDRKSFPFEFYNRSEKQYEGVVVQILDRVKELTGFKFEYILTNDFEEALQYGINLQADIAVSRVHEGTGFILSRQLAKFSGHDISIQYTKRMPLEVVTLINRAIDTISEEDISSIIASEAVQYEKMSDDTKVYITIVISAFILAAVTSVTILTAYYKYKKQKDLFMNTDRLTGYPNIKGLKSVTDVSINSLNISSYCMVNLAVNNLNYIREVFGYSEADKVQTDIAIILDDLIYNNEILSKANNDDFILLLQFTEKSEMVSRINQAINRINEKYELKKSEYPVVLSIGVYTPKYEEINMDILMQKSLQARQFIKEKDEIRYRFYDETIHIMTVEENLMQQEFLASMEKGEFLIYIQPKIALFDNSICGGEILSRWYNPRRGLIRPGEYIPVFEKSGNIIEFDMYMFEKACQLLAQSLEGSKKVVPVSVNFSRSHFVNTDFCNQIFAIAAKYQVPPYYLNIEVTESLIAENAKMMNEIVNKLKELGFTISLDDFGTGYASFSDLPNFMLDFLKLDKSMIYNLENSKTKKMIKGITDIAHNMDLQIICEGVETKEQAEILKLLECDIVQGYYYYQPMPYEEFEKILQPK